MRVNACVCLYLYSSLLLSDAAAIIQRQKAA